ncbi:hypothetical protein AB0J90_18240 [Micromonospora sp. NPDC049523]|uniref:hypothetical protein n=1 Tax=Micromonospora sp. NPDC049523 TaxID=3155921 RepID=UPI003448A695
MATAVPWADLTCFVGRSAHIPQAITDLSSPVESVRRRAFLLLAHDLGWNENLFEATPYAIVEILERLEHREIPDAGDALELLRRLGNGEAADPESIVWHGQQAALLPLCRGLVEDGLELYVSYLADLAARSGALFVISSFRNRVDEAEAVLRAAADSAETAESREEMLAAIDDLREWNEPEPDRPQLDPPKNWLEARVARNKAAVARLQSGERPAPAKMGPLLSIRQRLIQLITRNRDWST